MILQTDICLTARRQQKHENLEKNDALTTAIANIQK